MKREFRYGRKIQEFREARAWTQEQLAAAADIETRTVQRVEKDITKNPETLQAIAGALDVDLENLRTTWHIPESRLLKTWLLESFHQFVSVEQTHSWHECIRVIMAPLTNQGQQQVNELLDRIFADRDVIDPFETEMWNCYVQHIEKPMEALFDLRLAIFLLDERRDLLLRSDGVLKPEKPWIDDWRVQHFLVVPRYGCFRMSRSELLHGFNENCRAAGDALFQTIKECKSPGVQVFTNALFAATANPSEGVISWCETCFPLLPDGLRFSLEYIERATGLTAAELHSIYETTMVEQSLQGLS